MKIDKNMMVMAAGAATGVVVPVALKKYLPDSIPYIGTYLGVWGTYPVFVPIVTGGIAFVLGAFTKVIKNDKLKNFLAMYGITALIGGIASGALFPSGRARVASSLQPVRYNGGVPFNKFSPEETTKTYYPDFVNGFERRPQTMAKGWGSDVTRNPMAATPTKITKEINYA